MNLKKAVITAAGRNHNSVPLQVLVDCDGAPKSAMRIILEEAIAAGTDEICIVIAPGERDSFLKAAGQVPAKLTFVEQHTPRGYGHALYCARDFVGNDSFLHLVSDHLYLSNQTKRCAEQLADVARREACAVSAVQATRETMLPFYGTVGGKGVPNKHGLYQVEKVIEKPTPTEAEQQLLVPGLRTGHYLCFFGMHVLTHGVMTILEQELASEKGPIQLSQTLARLAAVERYLAFEIPGSRHNLGVKFGTLNAQLALALAGSERDEVLTQLVELLAQRNIK